jgi:hypothetical protein
MQQIMEGKLGQDVADKLDELHLRKIDLADSVYVLNVGGYIGSSTQKEIEYAQSKDKPIEYLEPIKKESDTKMKSAKITLALSKILGFREDMLRLGIKLQGITFDRESFLRLHRELGSLYDTTAYPDEKKNYDLLEGIRLCYEDVNANDNKNPEPCRHEKWEFCSCKIGYVRCLKCGQDISCSAVIANLKDEIQQVLKRIRVNIAKNK